MSSFPIHSSDARAPIPASGELKSTYHRVRGPLPDDPNPYVSRRQGGIAGRLHPAA